MSLPGGEVVIDRVAIVGAGAMGCLFAARLQAAGTAVTLIDTNAERLAVIGRDGLELVDDQGTRRVRPGTSAARQFAGPVDLVVLFTKGMHSAAAVDSVAHLAAGRPVALTLQNGLGNAEVLAAAFGPGRVVMGTAHIPADLRPPNRVVTHGFAHIDLGGFEPAAQPLAEPVARLLTRAGFEPEVRGDVEAAIWEKLAFNAALNAVGMITRRTNAGLDNDSGRRLAQAVVAEAVAVAGGRGLALDAAGIDATVRRALAQHPGHKASMLQDREAGRPTEIETINGAIVREGERRGIATPVNAALADLVRLIEAP